MPRPPRNPKPKPQPSLPQDVATAAETRGMSPLAYMLTVMRDPKTSQRRRDRMAVTAARYLHPRPGDVGKKELRDEAARSAGGREWLSDLEYSGGVTSTPSSGTSAAAAKADGSDQGKADDGVGHMVPAPGALSKDTTQAQDDKDSQHGKDDVVDIHVAIHGPRCQVGTAPQGQFPREAVCLPAVNPGGPRRAACLPLICDLRRAKYSCLNIRFQACYCAPMFCV